MRGRSGLSILLLASLLAVPAVYAAEKNEKKKSSMSTAEPPCSAAHYRQFDFWVGEWDVVDGAGKPAGRNRVVSVFDGCALQENWESAKGARGTSLTVYDAVTGHWHQTWVDDHGGLLELNGAFSDGRMVLIGNRPSLVEKGTRVVHRITWTPLSADRVRQAWEFSKNEGRTWTTLFDGTYVKKK